METKRKSKIIITSAIATAVVVTLLILFFSGKINTGILEKLVFSDFIPVSFIEKENTGLTVDFIDVGQGDSALITCDGKSMLVDTGNAEYYDIVKFYLDKRNVEKLDIVIATHPHSDHIGSMSKIIENYEIGTFIMPSVEKKFVPDTDIYQNLNEAIKENSVNVHYAEVGDVFHLSSAEIEILSPQEEYENLNDMSVIFMLTYGENKFLFMADAEEKAEKSLVKSGKDLKCDILKVGHNGSDTSSTEDFIEYTEPEIAVISVGQNQYGHPHEDVIERLLRHDILIYRTDYENTVSFRIENEKSEIIKVD